MLVPADGVEGVKNAVLEIVKHAGPNPCPPIVLGVGIGGTMDQAAVMSKKALLRDISTCLLYTSVVPLQLCLLSKRKRVTYLHTSQQT